MAADIGALLFQHPAVRKGKESTRETHDDQRKRPSSQETGGASLKDPVIFSTQLDPAKRNTLIVERAFSRVESSLDRARENLFPTAKAESEAQVARDVEDSPDGTAMRILDGIRGYIFDAFRFRHPELSEAQMVGFHSQVREGFEEGLRDAKDILMGLQVMTSKLAASIDQTASIVREGLDEFFARTLEEILGQSSADDILL